MPVRAAAVFGERLAADRAAFLLVHEVDDDAAVGELEGGFHRVGQTLADTVLDHESVDHDLDGVLLLLGEFDVVGQLRHLAVDERAGVAVGAQQLDHIHELALAALDHGRENLESRAFRVAEQRVDDLLRGLGGDGLAAFRAVRDAGAGEEQSQVIVDFGDGADGRTRVAVGGLLVDGDGRAQALDEVNVGLVHLTQELAGVGG